jgi:endonuclease YncB( thermonuclease family)
MKTTAIIVMVIALSILSATACQAFSGKVIAVQDGDNITIMNNSSAVTVRLYCIACPAQGQDYQAQAIKFLQDLMVGQNADVNVKWQDYSNRQVSKVKINGNDVGAQITAAGLAWYDNRVYQDGEAAAGQAQAQAQKLCIWSQPNPVSPWDFLTNQRGIVPNTSGPITNISGQGYSAPAANQDLDAGTSWEDNSQPLGSGSGPIYGGYYPGGYGGVYNRAATAAQSVRGSVSRGGGRR